MVGRFLGSELRSHDHSLPSPAAHTQVRWAHREPQAARREDTVRPPQGNAFLIPAQKEGRTRVLSAGDSAPTSYHPPPCGPSPSPSPAASLAEAHLVRPQARRDHQHELGQGLHPAWSRGQERAACCRPAPGLQRPPVSAPGDARPGAIVCTALAPPLLPPRTSEGWLARVGRDAPREQWKPAPPPQIQRVGRAQGRGCHPRPEVGTSSPLWTEGAWEAQRAGSWPQTTE